MPKYCINNIILLALLIITTFLHLSLSELCDPNDKKVLLQIKQAFNNPHVFSSWNPSTDCCINNHRGGWNSVACDEKTHRVAAIFVLEKGDLAGPIPPQVGDLPYLEEIEFHKQPNLTGPIPHSLTKLRSLKTLTIVHTGLSGPIPGFVAELTSLERVDLSFNNLTGPIPGPIFKLPRLDELRLHRNRLTGPIPDTFGEPLGTKLSGLQLSDNELSGQIPPSLGKLDLPYIDLSGNKLEGDASVIFWPNKTANQIVVLSRNMFEFDLSKVDKLSEMFTYFDVSHNKITGKLPVGLTSLEFLYLFNVSYNRLCGQIPIGGRLQKLDYTAFFHNRCLCGPPLESCKK